MGWQDRAYNRDESGGVPPVVFSFPKLTRLTGTIMGLCLVIFLAQSFTRESGELPYWGMFTFRDGIAFKQPWRWITYQYLHADAGHLFFNMLALYFFLPSLELMWGWRKALAFYTMGGIFAGVTFGLLAMIVPGGTRHILIGASGSIMAAIGAVALLSPNRQLILLVFPVPIRVAAALIGGFYLLSAVADQNLSDAAHVGGLAFGFFAPWLAGPYLSRMQRRVAKNLQARSSAAELNEQLRIDEILEKVHQKGMNSLSWAEKRALKGATERQRRVDAARRNR